MAWDLEVGGPSKIRNFLWKGIKGAIATQLNLFKRKCAMSPLCPICNECQESIEHLLFFGPWVDMVWFSGPLNYKVEKSSITNFDV